MSGTQQLGRQLAEAIVSASAGESGPKRFRPFSALNPRYLDQGLIVLIGWYRGLRSFGLSLAGLYHPKEKLGSPQGARQGRRPCLTGLQRFHVSFGEGSCCPSSILHPLETHNMRSFGFHKLSAKETGTFAAHTVSLFQLRKHM